MKGSRSIIVTTIALGLLAGSLVAVTAQEEDAAVSPPAEFTGHIVCGPEVRSGTQEFVPDAAGSSTGLRSERGYAWQPYTTEMSEPRLEGDYYISYDTDVYSSGVSVGSGTWRIENEEGAWQGSYRHADGPADTTTDWMSLVGEGAYEGLTVIWETVYHPEGLCNWDVRGVIIESEPPAVPEAYVGE